MLSNRNGAARLRRLWLSLHLWTGLSVGVLLVALGLSGSLLVWRDSLDRLGNPARYAVTAGNPALPPSVYLANAAAALGNGFAPQTIRYPEGDGSPVVVQARNAGNAAQAMRVYMDPPTGRVLDTADFRSSLLGTLVGFHENLRIPEYNGRSIVGWTGVAMLISALTGIWLWWPRHGAFRRGLRWRRGPGTASNLHHRLGIFIAVPLAVVSVTGIYIAFPQQGRQLLGSVAAMTPPGPRPGFAQPLARPALGVDRVLDMALKAELGARPAMIALPSRQAPIWRIQLEGPDAAELITVTVDDASTTLTKLPTLPGDQIAQWVRWLHEGSHAGLGWRLAVFCSGVFPAVFFVTGLMIWWHRRRPRAVIAPAARAPTMDGREGTILAGPNKL